MEFFEKSKKTSRKNESLSGASDCDGEQPLAMANYPNYNPNYFLSQLGSKFCL